MKNFYIPLHPCSKLQEKVKQGQAVLGNYAQRLKDIRAYRDCLKTHPLSVEVKIRRGKPVFLESRFKKKRIPAWVIGKRG